MAKHVRKYSPSLRKRERRFLLGVSITYCVVFLLFLLFSQLIFLLVDCGPYVHLACFIGLHAVSALMTGIIMRYRLIQRMQEYIRH